MDRIESNYFRAENGCSFLLTMGQKERISHDKVVRIHE